MTKRSKKMGKWADVVSVKSRFQRSVNLERDALHPGALAGYVVTPLVRSLTVRILEGFRASPSSRAWSITGPYGTGKSAFVTFLAGLLASPVVTGGTEARKLLQATDRELYELLVRRDAHGLSSGLCPVLATGERQSADVVLLRALHEGLERFWRGPGAKPGIIKQVEDALKRASKGKHNSAKEVVELFRVAASKVASSSAEGKGLLVVLDEAGKLLEYAAQDPSTGDIHVLQELAEASHRSEDAPLLFITVLHQGFEQYASRLSLLQRNEWAKVQGRFGDLAFQETAHEMLHLLGEAIAPDEPQAQLDRDLYSAVRGIVPLLVTATQSKSELERLLLRALPLHPTTALVLGPLFRSGVAQNERSLFAFLSADEPNGFKDFLSSESTPALYTPDRLYDYVSNALGNRGFGHLGRQWALIETALHRLPKDAEELDARIVKCIGLLGIFGDAAGVRADPELLSLLYGKGAGASISRLESASLIIFRKYRAAYHLWEGSDVDIDALIREAMAQTSSAAVLTERMTRIAPPRPLVAKQHFFKTGTLRYFDVRYVDAGAVASGVPLTSDDADGAVLLVLEADPNTRSALAKALQNELAWLNAKSAGKPVLMCVPPQAVELLSLGSELMALEWVLSNTPELQGDPAATRELKSRLAACEQRLKMELQRVVSGEIDVRWFSAHGEEHISGPREFARRLSTLCDESYAQAPYIHNELINRRSLSSAAAAARRGLLEVMVAKPGLERLGLEGTPPEVSIYRSVLEVHGLHRCEQGVWAFREPGAREQGSLLPVWRELARMLDEARELRVKVSTIFERLLRPPFGLKEGVLPLILVAAIMAWKDEMALYEEQAFVATLNAPTLERLVKYPGEFELQRFTIGGARAALYEKLARMLLGGAASVQEGGLLPVVRRLVRIVKDLPEYARLTKSVPERAQNVRSALLSAREPATLIFSTLPVACGFSPFGTEPPEGAVVDAFVESLRSSIRDLQGAYDRLLGDIESMLRDAFSLPTGPEEMRRELVIRCKPVLAQAVEPKLKAFCLRVSDEMLERNGWLVSVGTLLANKPPEMWAEQDVENARLAVGHIARRFSVIESLLVGEDEASSPADLQLIRVSVAQTGRSETDRVVPLRGADARMVERVSARLRGVLDEAAASLPREALLAALGLVARDFMADLGHPLNASRTREDA